MLKNERSSFQLVVNSDSDNEISISIEGFNGKTKIFNVKDVPVNLACFENADDHRYIQTVTTSSFPIAEVLLTMNLGVKIRASEGLHFTSVRQLEFTKDHFSGYFIGGESVRDLETIQQMRKWCDDNGRTLHLVPNNACLYRCPYYLYHSNLQSHIQDMQNMAAVDAMETDKVAPCERLLATEENRNLILKGMWIRPEDLHHVAYYFDSMRLETRRNPAPQNIVEAYCEEKWDGNLCDILEAIHDHGAVFPVIPNSRFPKGWFKKTSCCRHHCESCHYCEDVLQKVISG